MRLPLLACLFTLAAVPAHAEWQVIHAGQLLDRPGQPARGASTLVLADGKVHGLHAGHLAVSDIDGVPADAVPLDLRDYFVMPGLIDSHVHLTSDTAGVQAQLDDVTLSPAAKAFDAAVNARKTLMAGFTTVRNLGDVDGVTLALRDAIRDGKTAGPRILDAGTSISATAGHMDPTLGFREELHAGVDRHENTCNGADDCRRAVRRQVGRGVDVIKFASTGGVNSRIGAGLGQQIFEDEARAIIDTAHLYNKKVAVHAHGADGILLALKLGADSIEHGTLLDEVGIKAFLDADAYYVPTLSTVNGYKERLASNPGAYEGEVLAKIQWRIGITGKSLRMAVPRGVKIAFGTDAGVSKHGRNADEFLLMVEHGMSPAAALKAATVNAADLLGLGAEIGTLEPGKQADLIAVRGNPLEDVAVLQQVDWVIQGGKVMKSKP
jgi:imidazolonepropionase-like amidohydrolase